MTLFEEFLLREKMAKSLADADACQARIESGVARIEACEVTMRRIAQEFARHVAALRSEFHAKAEEVLK